MREINVAATTRKNMAAPELARALEAAVTGLHLLGATAKDYDAHTAAKGVLEKRVYVGAAGAVDEEDAR